MASVENVSAEGETPSTSFPDKTIELEELKSKFGPDCRIIENIGDFAYVVQVRLKAFDVVIKFQVSDGYPAIPVGVIVTSQNCSETVDTELLKFLANYNGSGLMMDYVEVTEQWLTENPRLASPESVQHNVKKQKPKKKSRITNTEQEFQKKTSMKTAEDVIKRIQWDSNLEQETFTVGYLDRFTGLTEKNFSTFSWEDLASVDYTVLAIPKHRIQYFKYKDVVVWDKRKRLDNVFGSTGSNATIMDVIANYVQEETPRDDVQTNHAVAQSNNDHGKQDDLNSHSCNDDDDDDDDESDDDICVTLESKTDVYDEASDDDAEQNLPWQNKLRPNYFLCQRITSSDILKNVDMMQSQILDLDSRYLDCCINPCMLHLTLCTLGLHQPEHVVEVGEILRANRDDLAEMTQSGLGINISGVSNFYERVVYGKVIHNEKFLSFVEYLRSLICEAGINICDNYEFVPHMTILKVTRPVVRQIGTKRVPSWMYTDFSDFDFGTQLIDGIHLCAMKGKKLPGNFYDSPAYVSLS